MKKTLIPAFILSSVLFTVSLMLGLLVPPEATSELFQELDQVLEPLRTESQVLLAVFIFINNTVKALGVFVLGTLLGIPPLIFICTNGLIIGAVVSGVKSVMGLIFVTASLVPHGVVEIPIVLLATALGFMMGWESLKRLLGRKSEVKLKLIRGIKIYMRWVLPGLFIAAIIETFITPWIVSIFSGV